MILFLKSRFLNLVAGLQLATAASLSVPVAVSAAAVSPTYVIGEGLSASFINGKPTLVIITPFTPANENGSGLDIKTTIDPKIGGEITTY